MMDFRKRSLPCLEFIFYSFPAAIITLSHTLHLSLSFSLSFLSLCLSVTLFFPFLTFYFKSFSPSIFSLPYKSSFPLSLPFLLLIFSCLSFSIFLYLIFYDYFSLSHSLSNSIFPILMTIEI